MIQNIRGTKDILPDQISQWQNLERIFNEVTTLYGYKELRTPIFEKTEVFSRSIGDNTDIVNKEMYTFTDKGGESVTLRPEMTAALVRSVIQNSLTQEVSSLRLWYFGPFFRYERPQKGRLRQFHQFGAECIASPYPESDVEIILLANQLVRKAGISDYQLNINTLGNEASRALYKDELTKYLTANKEQLSEESKLRLETNPLRVLDSKSENDKLIIESAPSILDFLDDESRNHFDVVKSMLDDAKVLYVIDPKLVRGLDYYCHTVFEFKSGALGAQDAFGGGGRYDGLFSQLGGKITPAVGFAMGVERLLLIIENSAKEQGIQQSDCDVFIVSMNENLLKDAFKISEMLRAKGYRTFCDLQRRSMKAQMRETNKLNAKHCIIIGDDEIKRNAVTIKNMITSEQVEIKIDLLHTISFR
ncbi:MAG: histidine--tRNA ligase [Candidatus Kapabacteria bacterium]|nr:histidine--tRNA ligase [Candidatus Kapabacteria bacterium]